jgi:DNA replication licensing factor MCM5
MAPRLSPEAGEKLSSHFVSIRKQVHAAELEANARSSIPITVRQLEAIIRITESLAKLSLSPIADVSHVDEAIRLFLASTMDAVTMGSTQGSKELNEEVNKLEDELKRRLPIGWSTSLATLKREMVEGKGFSEQALVRAITILFIGAVLRCFCICWKGVWYAMAGFQGLTAYGVWLQVQHHRICEW